MTTLPPRIRAILQTVSQESGVLVGEILGEGLKRRVTGPRQEAMRRMKVLAPSPSFARIGRWFGRDHSTVIHACR